MFHKLLHFLNFSNIASSIHVSCRKRNDQFLALFYGWLIRKFFTFSIGLLVGNPNIMICSFGSKPNSNNSLLPNGGRVVTSWPRTPFLRVEIVSAVATHWNLTYSSENGVMIVSGNGLSPLPFQAIAWTSADKYLSIRPLVKNFGPMIMRTYTVMKMHLKMSSAKRCSFLSSLNVNL